MNLQPSDAEPGLWVNQDWSEGEPGLFAVVIGVSAYHHLAPDEQSAADADRADPNGETTYGLGQLRVSALTARRIFEWLRDGYRIEGCPLAKCWLLLSPRDRERQFAPEIEENLTEPTIQNCERALRFWRSSMRALPRPNAAQSRSLLFFSGHGLEVVNNHQILLPSDYLAPPDPSWNDAISTTNLQLGLLSTPVGRQFFFVDACRNDHRELRSKNVKGRDILSEDQAALACPEIVATPVLYATGTGQRSFQPDDPQKGESIFGQALLAGLAGKPDLELEQRDGAFSVRMYSLDTFVKERVVQLIKDAQNDVDLQMPVVFAGTRIGNEDVTLLDAPPAAGAQPGPLPPPHDPSRLVAAGMPPPDDRTLRVESALEPTREQMHVLAAPKHSAWARDYNVGHPVFGSEHITHVWSDNLRIFAIGASDWIDTDAFALHRVDRDEGTRHFRLEASIENDDPVGHWLQVIDTSERAHGCVLPNDRYTRPRFTIEFDALDEGTRGSPNGRRFSRLDCFLSREDESSKLRSVADLWMRLRAGDMGHIVSAFEESALGEEMGYMGSEMVEIREHHERDALPEEAIQEAVAWVRDKMESPLAATVASLLLFRTSRLDLVKDWVRNLANWFPARPDGAVLWAEQVMRLDEDRHRAVTEASSYLTRLLQHGLPHTNEALAYAVTLTDRLLSIPDGQLGLGAELAELAELRSRLDHALAHNRPGGLFASYTAFDPSELPTRLLGMPT